jgi:hypothetical protein
MMLLMHADPQIHLHNEPLVALLICAAYAALVVFRRQRS